jgi:hypothetical protein
MYFEFIIINMDEEIIEHTCDNSITYLHKLCSDPQMGYICPFESKMYKWLFEVWKPKSPKNQIKLTCAGMNKSGIPCKSRNIHNLVLLCPKHLNKHNEGTHPCCNNELNFSFMIDQRQVICSKCDKPRKFTKREAIWLARRCYYKATPEERKIIYEKIANLDPLDDNMYNNYK